MKDLEYLFYEAQPYLYGALALVGLSYSKTSNVALGAALVLGACSLAIFNMRRQYRQAPRKISQR